MPWTGTFCLTSDDIILEIKCAINVMFLNHCKTSPPRPQSVEKRIGDHCSIGWDHERQRTAAGSLGFVTKKGVPTTISLSKLSPVILASDMPTDDARNAGDLGSIPGLGGSPGEGKGYPLQYSCLENSMDCTVHGVTKSRTRLSDFHYIYNYIYISCCCLVAESCLNLLQPHLL